MNKKNFREFIRLRPIERHSLILLTAGLMYIAMGISLIAIEPTHQPRTSLYYAFRMLPHEIWGIFFMLIGGTAILSGRWPTFSITWGYIVLTGFSGGWAAIYCLGALYAAGKSTAAIGALSWILITFLWWALSGLINPPHRPKRRE